MSRVSAHVRADHWSSYYCYGSACVHLPSRSTMPGKRQITLDAIAAQRSNIRAGRRPFREQKKQALGKLDEARALLEESRRYEAPDPGAESQDPGDAGETYRFAQGCTGGNSCSCVEDIAPWTIARRRGVVLNERQQRLQELQAVLDERIREVAAYVAFARTGVSEIAKLQERLSDLAPAGIRSPVTGNAAGAQPGGTGPTECACPDAQGEPCPADAATAKPQHHLEVTQLDRDRAAD